MLPSGQARASSGDVVDAQHEMALSFGLLVLLAFVRPARPFQLTRDLADGWLLGGAMAVSSFNGVLLVGWYALMRGAIWPSTGAASCGDGAAHRGLAAVVVAAYLGLMIGLGMVQSTPDSFILGWNRHFLRGPWRFLILSFGPALVLAPLGLAAVARASRQVWQSRSRRSRRWRRECSCSSICAGTKTRS